MKKILFMIFVLGIITCKPQGQQADATKGKIQLLIGEVSITHTGSKQVAKMGNPIAEGDTITTGDNAAAIIEFEGKLGSVEIQQNSEFTISKFNSKEQELISKRGSFWLSATKINKDSIFRVVMPTATAGIRGTKLYSFENKEAGITGICHCQGAVEFQEHSSHYSGSHDSDHLVITKGGKTIVITPEDFKKLGIAPDVGHEHSMLDNSPLGKKADPHADHVKKVNELIAKKFAEK